MALIVMNGGSRDLMSTRELFREISYCIEPERVVVGINFADMKMSGFHWDFNKSVPDMTLMDRITKREQDITIIVYKYCKSEIKNIVTYSAKYNYNIDGLLDKIIDNIPTSFRSV